MLDHPDPTIFESFNARQLTPQQVAETFVPIGDFALLCQRNNNLVVGPRGSGKTTLLKMLQISALTNWKHELADEITRNVDFVAAFVPTDIAWRKQWGIVEEIFPDSKGEMIKQSIFLTHTLRAIVDAFLECTTSAVRKHENLARFSIDLTKKDELAICSELADCLYLDIRLPSLDYLKNRLRRRLKDIWEVINRGRAGSVDIDQHSYLFLPYIETITPVLDVLNGYMRNSDQKWALLFDELELAPAEITSQLLSYQRSSSDTRLLFKLSMSPFSDAFQMFTSPESAKGDNDYKPISLWYSHKEQARPFCYSLFRQMCDAFEIGSVDPTDVFSESEFDLGNTIRASGASAYDKNSPLFARFERLRSIDPSFKAYLKRQSIDLSKMSEMSEEERASKIRKITNIVTVRNAWRRKGGVGSKRSPSLYTGATSIFDLTEGNPRLFIGIVGTLIQQYAKQKRPISITQQSRIVRRTTDRFLALLSTISVESAPGDCPAGILYLLDAIGDYLFDRVVRDKFSPEPPTTFIVDKNTPPHVRVALGKALNSGAIVYMPKDPSDSVLHELVDKRFRFAHLLAAKYKLPLLANKGRALSAILAGNTEDEVSHDLFEGPGS